MATLSKVSGALRVAMGSFNSATRESKAPLQKICSARVQNTSPCAEARSSSRAQTAINRFFKWATSPFEMERSAFTKSSCLCSFFSLASAGKCPGQGAPCPPPAPQFAPRCENILPKLLGGAELRFPKPGSTLQRWSQYSVKNTNNQQKNKECVNI